MSQPTPHLNQPRRHAGGFTIIELMVVVSIVAVLGTLAVSTYRSYILRANRTEARMALLATQVAQEKYFLQNNQYAPDIATVIAAPAAGGLGIPLSAGGVTTGGYYTISFSAITANSYTLQAVATGTQTKDTAACLIFTINDQGARTPADSTGCWR
jgi:type IV pilus assembly protein PilE